MAPTTTLATATAPISDTANPTVGPSTQGGARPRCRGGRGRRRGPPTAQDHEGHTGSSSLDKNNTDGHPVAPTAAFNPSPAEKWEQLLQIRPRPAQQETAGTTQGAQDGPHGTRGGRGGGRGGRGGRGGHWRGGGQGGHGGQGRGRGGQDHRRGGHNGGWRAVIGDCPPEVFALPIPERNYDTYTAVARASALGSDFDLGDIVDDDVVRNQQAKPDIRNQIGIEYPINDVTTDWGGPRQYSIFTWDNLRPNYKDDKFSTVDYWWDFVRGWLEQVDCEVNAHGIFAESEHWKCDVDTHTGRLVPSVEQPETSFNTADVDPDLDYRRKNFTSNILGYKVFLEIKASRNKRRDANGNAGPSNFRPARILHRGEDEP
ncbi:hypothetical protein VTJ49DRAFT_1210 [Mycothermus thermophilus]|uniref:Uncharacterized protein n=1 Tax=Humicola insolens TaxID=85995 RepID=A0ABR3VD19_HUMIN